MPRLAQSFRSDRSSIPVLTYLTLQETAEGQAGHAHVREIVAGLRRRGWAVTLLEPKYENPPSRLRRLLTLLALQISVFSSLRPRGHFYVRFHFLATPCILAARILRCNIVVEVNGPTTETYSAYPELRLVRGLIEGSATLQLRLASSVITVTDGLRDWVQEQAPNTTVSVVPNGANCEVFDPTRSASEAIASQLPEKYVVFFGSLSKWQGVHTMLEATQKESWPADVALVVIGDGQLRPDVLDAASKTDRVRYLGRQPYAEVAGIATGAVASLIIKEGNFGRTGLAPLKIYESLALNLPVIVSDYPGLREVGELGFGLVIPPGDPHSLARAVHEVGSGLFTAVDSRPTILSEASWDARAAQTNDVILCDPRTSI